jgi:putative ABC transport system permease protein
MRMKDCLLQALDSLRAHRMRALLTMLGIIVGIFTVILTLAIGAGAQQAIQQQISALGTNLIEINSGPPPAVGQRPVLLYAADARAILEECPEVEAVAPEQETRLPVGYGPNQLQDNFVMGVTASFAEVRRVALEEGRFIAEQEDIQAAKVALLGSTVEQLLFGGTDPIGRWITVSGVDFQVIGVFPSRGDTGPGLGPGMSLDDRVFIPLSSLQKRLLGSTDLRFIAIEARDSASILATAKQVRDLLNRRHPNNNFEVKTQLELMETSNSVSAIVTLLLTALAAVSLLVGGIGIMNIMLVAVTERTREIGIRRAVGARRVSILVQFLMESAILGSTGGAVGVMLGLVMSETAGKMLGWTVPVLPAAVALAVGASLFVGIVSGFYPARRAARLNLVDALRFE